MIAVLVGVFVFLALLTGAAVALAPRARRLTPEDRLRALGAAPIEMAARSVASPNRARDGRHRTRRPAGGGWTERTAHELRQADIRLRPVEYLSIRVALAAALLVAPVALFQAHPVALAAAPAGAVLGLLGPMLYVRAARRRRVMRIERQLLEFLPALASSLRSGFAFQAAVEVAIQQLGDPLAGELDEYLRDVQLGATTQTALQDLGRRVGSTDLDMVLTAVLVQRTTGGNLPEILDQTAEALRERDRIRGEIQTLTAQQRLTGLILSVYPVAIGLLLLAIMPAVWSKLFTEPAGQVQLAIAAALQVVGFFAIRRALRVEV
jgi:tight adherence protein B